MTLRRVRHVEYRLIVALLMLLGSSGLLYGNPLGIITRTGTLPDISTYLIEIPPNWNGTLLLYSHGYVGPGSPNPALDVSDPVTGGFLLSQGFALAGSSFASSGWDVHDALIDQIAVLDAFDNLAGTPALTIAWGHSLGGLVTAALIQQYPERFGGALPMCGILAGGAGIWNEALDMQYAFNSLLAGNELELVHLASPVTNVQNAEAALAFAQATPQGRARIALVAALADVPGWFDPALAEPRFTDYASREANQYQWLAAVDFPFVFGFRADLEGRAGGNPSYNTGINYLSQLARSPDLFEVVALYRAAGLNLRADLEVLKNGVRIAPDPAALEFLEQNIIFNGQIHVPVLTLHTTGDGLATVEQEAAYSRIVHEAEDGQLLRQLYVHRAGHCAFSPAEMITALQQLLARLQTGGWPILNPVGLNLAAASLGPEFNITESGQSIIPVSPSFTFFVPRPFLRPFDALNQH